VNFAPAAAAVWAARPRSRVALRKMLVQFSELVFFVALKCQIHRDVLSVNKLYYGIFYNETRCKAQTTTAPGCFQQSGWRSTSELAVRYGTRSKTPCNALLPRTCIVAVQHFLDHI